jgi:signal peptidase
MEWLKKLKENKIYQIIRKILKVFIVIVLLGFVLVVFLQRFSDNKISFFNYRMFTVISGSMEPKYKIGDVLIAKDVEASKIKVGDAISYEGKSGTFINKVITHEVIGIEKDETGKYVFRTKGLANIIEDPIVSEDQLYGVIIYKEPLLSAIYKIIQTNMGFYLFIIVPIMYIVGSEIISVLLEKEEKRRQPLKEKE